MNFDKASLAADQRPLLISLLLLPLWVLLYINLEQLAAFLVHTMLQIAPGTGFGEAARFFVFEVPKVLLLLTLIVFGVGIVRSYFSPERARAILGGRRLFIGNVLAGMLGIVTPFCSCSAIPLFLGFVESGVPLGVTFSFLIAAPMINEVALVMLLALFGWKTALLYASTGLAIAILSGYIIGRLRLERFVEDWVYKIEVGRTDSDETRQAFSVRVLAGWDAVKEIIPKVWLYIVLGIAVGSAIHGYVPENFMASLMGKGAWWSVPIAVLIGVPIYSNAAGIIPVVQALLEKGASLGTVLAFMMSVIGLSLPEVIILRKVLKTRLIAIFIGVVATGIIIVGFVFNAIF